MGTEKQDRKRHISTSYGPAHVGTTTSLYPTLLNYRSVAEAVTRQMKFQTERADRDVWGDRGSIVLWIDEDNLAVELGRLYYFPGEFGAGLDWRFEDADGFETVLSRNVLARD